MIALDSPEADRQPAVALSSPAPREPGEPVPVLWLASYPKSGNTWIRHILSHLTAPSDGRGTDYASEYGRRMVESLTRLGLHAGTGVTAVVPDVYQAPPSLLEDAPRVALRGGAAALVKTHSVGPPASFAELLPRADRNSADLRFETRGVVYVYRHPLDVALSGINYQYLIASRYYGKDDRTQTARFFRHSEPASVETLSRQGLLTPYIDDFIDAGLTFEIWRRMAGTWPENVAAWQRVAAGNPESVVCRYEDIHDQPDRFARQLAELLGTDPSSVTRAMAAAASTTEDGGRFFWRKRPRNFRSLLDAATIARLHASLGDVLERYGYCQGAD